MHQSVPIVVDSIQARLGDDLSGFIDRNCHACPPGSACSSVEMPVREEEVERATKNSIVKVLRR